MLMPVSYTNTDFYIFLLLYNDLIRGNNYDFLCGDEEI